MGTVWRFADFTRDERVPYSLKHRFNEITWFKAQFSVNPSKPRVQSFAPATAVMISFLRVLVLAATSCWSVAGHRNKLELGGISDFKYVSWPNDGANSGKITQGKHFGTPRITTRDDGEFIVNAPQEGSKEVFNWFMDGLESHQVIIPKKVGSDFEKLKMNFALQGTMTFNIRKDGFTFPISCPPMRIGQVHTHGHNVWLVGGTNCINDLGKWPNTQILDCKCGDAGQVVTFEYKHAWNSVEVVHNRLDIKLVTNACSIFKEVGGYWQREWTIPGSELLEVTSDALEVLTSEEMEKIHEVGIGVESSVSVDYMGVESYSYAQRKAIANSWKTSTTNTNSENVPCHEGFWVYRWVSTVTPLSSQCKVKEVHTPVFFQMAEGLPGPCCPPEFTSNLTTYDPKACNQGIICEKLCPSVNAILPWALVRAVATDTSCKVALTKAQSFCTMHFVFFASQIVKIFTAVLEDSDARLSILFGARTTCLTPR